MGVVKNILEKIENKELQIIGVKYKDKYSEGYSSKEYSYLADLDIKLYDKVLAETRYGSQRALVTSLNIPFEKVEKFADNLKFVTKEEIKENENEKVEEDNI